MKKSLFRAAALAMVAAVSLTACSNDDAGNTGAEPSVEQPTIAPEPTEDVTPEETVEPTQEPTTEAPSQDIPVNSEVKKLTLDECMPYIDAFTEIGTLSGDMANTEQPAKLVAAYTKTHELLSALPAPVGAEGDWSQMTKFYGFYAKNLQGVTTTNEVNTAMLKVLGDINASGMQLSDAMEYATNVGDWLQEACI